MKEQFKISDHFPSHLFWDVDPDRLDIHEDMELIIPRALLATTAETFEQDIRRLELLYAKDEIVGALKNTKERISNEVCEMVAKRYEIEAFWRFQS